MKAIVLVRDGGAVTPQLQAVPSPSPKSTELLIAVRAAGLNRADLRLRPVHYSHQAGASDYEIAGLEVAGEVIGMGSEVCGFSVGDRVMAMTSRAFAEEVTVDYRLVVPVPPAIDWDAAASIMVSFVTAFDALHRAAKLRAGESILIAGATTCAGLAAIQIARAIGAGAIVGTTRQADKADTLLALGCDEVIVTGSRPLHESPVFSGISDGPDVAIDIVGGETFSEILNVARVGARIVCLGRVSSAHSIVDLDDLSRKRLSILGVSFRTRTFHEHVEAVEAFREHALPMLQNREIAPIVDGTLPMFDVARALEYMTENTRFGKVVLVVTPD